MLYPPRGPNPADGFRKENNMIRILPVFKGYTVDLRLQEFRKIEIDKLPEFISLLSDKGAQLFNEFRQTEEGRKEIAYVLGKTTRRLLVVFGLYLFPTTSKSLLFGGYIYFNLIKRCLFVNTGNMFFEIDQTGVTWADK